MMLDEPATSPTARTLLTLELIQNSPGVTAERLADKLGVTGRAVRRYVAILREAGIPVEAVRGPYGGYRVGRGVRLPPLMFGSSEALALVMAVLDGHHDASDPTDLVGGALSKIMRALPAPVAAQAEAVRRTTAPAPDRAAVRPDPVVTTTLVEACADRCRVRIGYRSEAGSEWERDVEPWAVVVRHGRWYLLCRTVSRDAIRTYRVDRVQSVEVLGAAFTPPADLDPVALLEEHLASGWEYDVEVVIDAPLERVRPCVPRVLGRIEAIDADTTRLVGTTSNPTWYAEELARVPASFRIVECDEVRQSAAVVADRLLAATGRDEAVALVDRDGNVVGAAPRSVVRRDNLLHAATAVLVRNGAAEIYVHRRSPHKDWAPAHHDAAAGGIVTHGEEPMASARRELHEELGIAAAELHPLGLSVYEDDTTRVVEHVFETVWTGDITFADDEVVWGRWMTLHELGTRLADLAWPFVPDTRALLARLATDGVGDYARTGVLER